MGEGLTVEQLQAEDLKKERAKTNVRVFNEIRLRLNALTRDEITLLANTNLDEQKYISLIAFGRTYPFFREFIEDVLLEKIVLFDFKLTDMDYNVFFNKKSIDHEQLEKLTTLTQNKIKQVIFKVLEQGGLIDNVKERNIQIPLLTPTFDIMIRKSNPQDLKLLLNS